MATWKLSPKYKKSITDTDTYKKDELIITRETTWRYGTVFIDSDEIPAIDLENKDGLALDDIDYYMELGDLLDGAVDVIYPDELSDEEQEELDELWDQDGEYAWEEAGWIPDDSSIVFHGELELVERTDEE